MKLKQLLPFMFVVSLAAAFSLGPAQARMPTTPTTVITVTTTNDELNSNGNCSLREAVQAANCDCPVDACPAGSGKDTIVLDYDTYLLDLTGAGEDNNQTGDLDIHSDVRIESWTSLTKVDGNATDRVFHVHLGVWLELLRLTVTNGRADGEGGGGIYSEGQVGLDTVWVKNNVSTSAAPGGAGGGIYNDHGILYTENSYIRLVAQ